MSILIKVKFILLTCFCFELRGGERIEKDKGERKEGKEKRQKELANGLVGCDQCQLEHSSWNMVGDPVSTAKELDLDVG